MVRMPVLVLINEAWMAFCGEVINSVRVCVSVCVLCGVHVHKCVRSSAHGDLRRRPCIFPPLVLSTWFLETESYLREAFTWLICHRAPRNSLTWPPNAGITVAMPGFFFGCYIIIIKTWVQNSQNPQKIQVQCVWNSSNEVGQRQANHRGLLVS